MLECLNGMRVLSAFWVIYAHSNVMALGGPVFNILYLLEVCMVTFLPLLKFNLFINLIDVYFTVVVV